MARHSSKLHGLIVMEWILFRDLLSQSGIKETVLVRSTQNMPISHSNPSLDPCAGLCLPAADYDYCPAISYCFPGQQCCGVTCIGVSLTCCASGEYCTNGLQCCTGGGCCAQGTYCSANGTCDVPSSMRALKFSERWMLNDRHRQYYISSVPCELQWDP